MEIKKDKPGIQEILKNFLDNRYSVKDVDILTEYINNQPNEKLLKMISSDFWYHHTDTKMNKEEDALDFNHLLDGIHHQINLEQSRPMMMGANTVAGNILRSSVNVFYRIAAVLVIGLLIASALSYLGNGSVFPVTDVGYSEISAPSGSKVKVDLPDGSYAWLNHGAVLRYPPKFGRGSRELFLTGEAYFDVKEDKHHPFVVQTSDLNVHVLGTSFNVMAYDKERQVEVTLEKGIVELYCNKENKSSKKIAILRPGQRAVFDRDSKNIALHCCLTYQYTGWKDNFMVFRGDNLETIAKKLERRYNVEIEISDAKLADYKFTATFTDETLFQVLSLLSVAEPMEFFMTMGEKQPDSTYSKGKVILKLKN